jgi:integrase
LRAREGIAARALEFTILTAARTGEVLGATWSEFDFQARVWTVPAGRKGGEGIGSRSRVRHSRRSNGCMNCARTRSCFPEVGAP